MKFDMHCHTKEGSIDGKVPIEDYIRILKERGFSGMLVTDHDSYNGYRAWKTNLKGKKHQDFVVLKGIEYDTLNAGHMIVIIPENIKPRILEVRGLPVQMLINIVHKYGGILGPAHPCGEKFMSYTHTKLFKKSKNTITKQFDFIETYNACESEKANEAARRMAQRYKLPGFGGSDAHRENCIGLAFTDLPKTIRKESDLIAYVKEKQPIEAGGTRYLGTAKSKLGKSNEVLVYSFWLYNRGTALLRKHKRKKKMNTVDHNEIPVSGTPIFSASAASQNAAVPVITPRIYRVNSPMPVPGKTQ